MRKLNENVTLRNIQEQVEENKRQIAKHWDVDRVLADFGIKMLGRFDSYEDIEDFDEGENYGNAYLIGTEEPYDVYVWTRADENAGQPKPYWLDIGPISLVGPQGPAPAIFNDGEYIYYIDTETNVRHNIIATADLRGGSTRWYVGTPSAFIGEAKEGDLVLYWGPGTGDNYGDVYQREGSTWKLKCNIRGPKGIQGSTGPAPIIGNNGSYITATNPQTGVTTNVVSLESLKGGKGDTGDPGGLVNIYSILPNASQLPSPSILKDVTAAFLVGTQAPYDLYVQVGANPEVSTWQNTGPFNVGTMVTVDGQYQNVWDADTKLDKAATTALTQYSIPFWKDGKFAPLGDLKTYSDGKQVYMGDENTEKMAFNDTIVYQQSKKPSNDPRKAAMSGRGGFTLSNFAKNVTYGYDNITITPTVGNEFETFDNANKITVTLPTTSGKLVTNNEVITHGYNAPIRPGFKPIGIYANLEYTDSSSSITETGILNVTLYQNTADATKRMVVFDYYSTSDESVPASGQSILGYSIGKWQSQGIKLHEMFKKLILSSGLQGSEYNLRKYPNIYVNEYQWNTLPTQNNNWQFRDSAIISPQIYDAISSLNQATVYGLAVRFNDTNINKALTLSGKHMVVTLTNFN